MARCKGACTHTFKHLKRHRVCVCLTSLKCRCEVFSLPVSVHMIRQFVDVAPSQSAVQLLTVCVVVVFACACEGVNGEKYSNHALAGMCPGVLSFHLFTAVHLTAHCGYFHLQLTNKTSGITALANVNQMCSKPTHCVFNPTPWYFTD